ncbi:MAG: hypothetical protein CMM10_10245 [Rhodospirillaceae bacterium]|nr:hypothetical protein [Rhodospirillaceae bacterium]
MLGNVEFEGIGFFCIRIFFTTLVMKKYFFAIRHKGRSTVGVSAEAGDFILLSSEEVNNTYFLIP